MENQKLMYFCTVATSTPPWARASSLGSRCISSQARCTVRRTPLSPTNMWCASSVSMKRVVRESGSKPLSARASSWYLPSRSVKVVNMKKESQSSMGSLKVVRILGLSKSPERRSSSSSASSRPSRPKWAWSR